MLFGLIQVFVQGQRPGLNQSKTLKHFLSSSRVGRKAVCHQYIWYWMVLFNNLNFVYFSHLLTRNNNDGILFLFDLVRASVCTLFVVITTGYQVKIPTISSFFPLRCKHVSSKKAKREQAELALMGDLAPVTVHCA